MRTIGAAGMGSMLGAGQALAQPAPAPGGEAAGAPAAKVPTRPLGRTGVKVSTLALGGIFDITTNQLVVQRAYDHGVTYWDTAYTYTGGKSEQGIGMFFERNPRARGDIFLVSKSNRHDPETMSQRLDESLQRMKTSYIDMYFLHGLRGGGELTDDMKAWAEKAKASKKIRFVGFSAHANMAECLQAAARAGWVDGIMLKYDYRLMHTDDMRAAMDACEKAGIGLTAMKTQGGGPVKSDNEADLKLGGHFMQRGFTEAQAKLKAVWENPQIATICSQMPSVTILTANVAAALDKTKLTAADRRALRQYADDTCSQYCAGCTRLCEDALANRMPVGDVMRALMYHRSYGDLEWARGAYALVPEAARRGLGSLDFAAAERACPQHLPIGRLLREANELLA
jgi:uncharacterized protein